jgi:hypothetical protein
MSEDKSNSTNDLISNIHIHITFQVLNFLTSELAVPFKISNTEFKVLIILSSFIGKKGICPSIPLLAKRANVIVRNMHKTLAHLKFKKLLTWAEKKGCSNQYSFPFLNVTPVAGDRGCEANLSTTPVAGDIQPLSPATLTPVAGDREVYISNSLSNKSLYYKDKQKTENEKQHGWAAMKNESASIKKNEETKRSYFPESLRELYQNIGKIKEGGVNSPMSKDVGSIAPGQRCGVNSPISNSTNLTNNNVVADKEETKL